MYNEVEEFLIVISGQKKYQDHETVGLGWLLHLLGRSFPVILSHNWFSADEKRPATHGGELDAASEGGFVISHCATSAYPSALLGLGETFGLYSNFARGFIKSTLVTAANRKPWNQPGGLNAAVVVSPCFSSDVAARMKDETC